MIAALSRLFRDLITFFGGEAPKKQPAKNPLQAVSFPFPFVYSSQVSPQTAAITPLPKRNQTAPDSFRRAFLPPALRRR